MVSKSDDIIHEAELILYKEQALDTLVSQVGLALRSPQAIFRVTGEWITNFHYLTVEYAEEIKAMLTIRIRGEEPPDDA